MAKISAHGNHKVAQANLRYTDDDGYDHKIVLALRSDGKVLRKHSLRSPMMRENYGSRGWNEGSYSVVPSIDRIDRIAFIAYVERRGYEVKA